MNICNNMDWISKADLRFYSRWTEIVTDLFGRGRLRRQDSASEEFVETFLQSKVHLYEKLQIFPSLAFRWQGLESLSRNKSVASLQFSDGFGWGR